MSSTTGERSRASGSPWWTGARGEWYLVAQLGFFALILVGPRTWPDGWLLPTPFPRAWQVAAAVLIGAGCALIVSGIAWLGRRNITPLPLPREHAQLVDSGPFALVRHPIYSGGFLAALGWALWVRGPLTLLYAVLFLVFLDRKSRREEQWLAERFAGYRDYQARVKRLIPFVY